MAGDSYIDNTGSVTYDDTGNYGTGANGGNVMQPGGIGGIPPANSGGGGGVWDALKGFFPGGGGSAFQMSTIPALATAAQQYNQSGQWLDKAIGLSGRLDPFASQRPGYQTQLSNLMSDPMQYISKMPSYQAALASGLGAINRGDMAKTGGGNITADDIAYGSQLGSQTFQQMVGNLTPLTGAQFGPSSAAALLGMGLQGSMQSQNAALAAMLFPWMQSTTPGSGNTPLNRSGGSQTPGVGGFNPPAGSSSFNWGGQQWSKVTNQDGTSTWVPANAAPISTPGGSVGDDTGSSSADGSLFPPGSGGDMGPPTGDTGGSILDQFNWFD